MIQMSRLTAMVRSPSGRAGCESRIRSGALIDLPIAQLTTGTTKTFSTRD